MPIHREWLDWSRPCLPAAAEWLIGQHRPASDGDSLFSTAEGGVCDLSKVACVLPGRRAGRLLLAQLLERCESRGVGLIPPEVLTLEPMVNRALGIEGAVATETEATLTWMAALKGMSDATLRPLLPRRPPAGDWKTWRWLAEAVRRIHEEVSGARLRFADVAQRVDQLAREAEGDRWRALATVHREYEAILKRAGLGDSQQVREKALGDLKSRTRHGGEIRQIVLVGITEMNVMQRAVVGSFGHDATALIHAPQLLADRFDEFGCVRAERWSEAKLGLGDEQIKVADRPEDQAQEALRALARFGGRYSAAEVTIGLGDEELARVISHVAEWAGVSVRSAAGVKVGQSPPNRALEAIAAWMESERFADFASLLRHPDVEKWLRRQTFLAKTGIADWLSLLDRYFADHLDGRFSGAWLGDDKRGLKLKAVFDAVVRLLGPLRHGAGEGATRRLGEWSEPIIELLARLYGTLKPDASDPAKRIRAEACLALRDVLAGFAAAPESLQPRVRASEAIRLALEQSAEEPVTQSLEDDQIEMLGWLELHLDLAPALIVAGFNEGNIPRSAGADMFLPDSLREQLGLACNARRYAREAYLLEAIVHSRPEVTVIAGRRMASGDPLTPSRLLLACDEQSLVERLARMCVKPEEMVRLAPMGMGNVAAAQSRFIVPELGGGLPPPERMRVTDFHAYLQCPYRYALSRVLKLEGFDDSALELDPLHFGILAHEVLHAFGTDAHIKDSADADEIERFLIRELDRQAATRYGESPMPAVRVQLARLKQRLRSFANLQGRLRAEGWRIEHCELNFDGSIALDIPGQEPMPLRGRIDRIDRNERSGAWQVIDYKTGEAGSSPHRAHHDREKLSSNGDLEWVDLQLPLYHYLAGRSEHKISGTIELAYICLAKSSDSAGLKAAYWTAPHLEDALEQARNVVRNIRQGRFERNREFHAKFDDFARICQRDVYGGRELDAPHKLEGVQP